MAIIDDSLTTHDTDTKIKELKTIDINDSSLPEGKEEKINPNADAWERACPPPDGTYHLKLHEAKIPYQLGETDKGDKYYVANLECKIIDSPNGSYDGVTVFGKVSSYIGVGKEISTMAGLIRKMGPIKIPEAVSHLAILKLLKKCLAQEPTLWCEMEWKAWDMPKGEWIKQGMKTFPKLEDGKYKHIVRDSKGSEVVAKLKPMRWFGNKEYREMMERDKLRKQQQGSNASAQAQANKTQTQTANKPNGGEIAFEEITPSKTNAQAAGNVSASIVDEDFVLDE